MGNRAVWTCRHDLPVESDEQLTDRARGGDQSAFGELYRRHRKAAESTAWCLLRSRSDADDVVSDAFTGVLSALRNGRGPRDNFRRYLLACVRNACRVRRTLHVGMSEDRLERLSPVLEDPERYIEADTVARAFSSLGPRWQHSLWLTEVEQRPLSEVSSRLQLSPNAAAALTHRARQAFATAYLAEHVAAVTDKDCARLAPQLAGYVRNQLPEPRLAALERHLVNCAHCSAAVADLRDVNASLRSLVPITPIAIGGAALAVETSFVATSVGGATVGLSGAGVALKGLVAVLLVAAALSTDSSLAARRSGQANQHVAYVGDVAAPGQASGTYFDPHPRSPVLTPVTFQATDGSAITENDDVDAQSSEDDRRHTVNRQAPDDEVLIDDVVEDGVRPLVDGVTEPLVETLDKALALMGLGSTGETVSMLRSLVPLLDGPLLGVVLDRLLDLTPLAPGALSSAGHATATTIPEDHAASVGDLSSDGAGRASGSPSFFTPPPIAPPISRPSLELPTVTLPSISAPPIDVPTISDPVLPAIAGPPLSLPGIGMPSISLPVISLPPINLPPITLPDLAG